jgi:hypothetical protein
MFQIAYPEVFKYPANRTFVEMKDSMLFQRKKDSGNKNLFCYELITPPVREEVILKYMQDDLIRIFNAVAVNESRLMPCYVLTTNKYIGRSLTREGLSSIDMAKESLHKHLKNKAVDDLVRLLGTLLDKPLVNETQLKQNIDIELPVNLYNYDTSKLFSFLYKKGFTITHASRSMEVAVIREAKN